MARVTGLGGVYFKSADPRALHRWYEDNLGMKVSDSGGVYFLRRDLEEQEKLSYTIWRALPEDSDYFRPGSPPYTLAYQVDSLDAVLKQVRSAGVAVDADVSDEANGRFAWFSDPDGNRVQLWEANGSDIEALAAQQTPAVAAGVTGIGGIFFKCRDPRELRGWYERYLGVKAHPQGAVVFFGREPDDADKVTYTVWSAYPEDTDYFLPSNQPYMFNFRVKGLDELLERLRGAGAEVDERIEEQEYGRFGWVSDPEGRRIELWEPKFAESM